MEAWLGVDADGRPLVALSRADVAAALAPELAGRADIPLPPGAEAALRVHDVPAVDRLLRRAFQLARTLPDEILHVFEERTAGLPRTTEAERLVVQRVGQDLFRERLLEYWEGRCAITGLTVPDLLRVSHIKPWAACETDAERLDVANGLLLAPHLDAAFDQGFITVAVTGDVVISERLVPEAREILGFRNPLRVAGVSTAHEPYLRWHREKVFSR